MNNSWPKTVDEAVDKFIASLNEEDINFIKTHKQNESLTSIQVSIDMGRGIRNRFGLWKDNDALMEDSGESHPDDASGIILDKVWDQLYEGFMEPKWEPPMGYGEVYYSPPRS